jgi:hypothetical protein
MNKQHHGRSAIDDRQQRRGIDNPTFQHEESQHVIDRITSPKRNRKTRSSNSHSCC